MKTSIAYQVLRASLLVSFISSVTAQSATAAAAGPIQTLECYQKPDPLTQDNTNTFQTDGTCQTACTAKGKPVMAITGGSTCYCGDELPALDQQVSSDKCDTPCQGYDLKMCGGIGYWQVYLTGLSGDVTHAPNTTNPSSSSASHPAQTVVVTQAPVGSSSAASSAAGSGGPNKVGIAVGVVVGVVVLAALVGGLVFFMRQKRKREIEEEYKQQAAISSFVNANKSAESKSTTDQRLDPGVYSARRESVGSIADERDFSRRILQVRNPDNRGSLASMA